MAKGIYHAHYHYNGAHGEDSFLIRQLSSDSYLYAVMDGLTNSGGKRASRLVKKKLQKGKIAAYADLANLMSDSNDELFRVKERGLRAYTTVAAALQVGKELYIISVGDSPAILVRGGQATQLVELDRLGRATVQAAVGLASILQPHYEKVALEKGDALVLMTDGVSDNLSFEGIAEIVTRSSATPRQAAAGLEAALKDARAMNGRVMQKAFRPDDATAVIRYFTSFA